MIIMIQKIKEGQSPSLLITTLALDMFAYLDMEIVKTACYSLYEPDHCSAKSPATGNLYFVP
jgi:hypothetical protein